MEAVEVMSGIFMTLDDLIGLYFYAWNIWQALSEKFSALWWLHKYLCTEICAIDLMLSQH